MKRFTSHAIACGASALGAALLVVLITGGKDSSDRPDHAIAKHDTAPRMHRLRVSSGSQRLRRVERRLYAVEQNRQTTPHDDDEPERKPPSADDERASWRAHLDAHEDESRDSSWAEDTEAAFADDLTALGNRAGFDYVNTDCRSDTCVARVAFANYDDALSRYSKLLHYEYRTNCIRQTLLPAPTDPSARYVASVLYDCSSPRRTRHALPAGGLRIARDPRRPAIRSRPVRAPRRADTVRCSPATALVVGTVAWALGTSIRGAESWPRSERP